MSKAMRRGEVIAPYNIGLSGAHPYSRILPAVGVRGWLLLLGLVLIVWNPATFASVAASHLAAGASGGIALVFLVGRLLSTAVGVAAGISLWNMRPGAVRLTKISLVVSSLEVALRMTSRTGLSEAPPGTRLPTALLTIAFNAAWYVYLEKSRRVRLLYGLESPRSES